MSEEFTVSLVIRRYDNMRYRVSEVRNEYTAM